MQPVITLYFHYQGYFTGDDFKKQNFGLYPVSCLVSQHYACSAGEMFGTSKMLLHKRMHKKIAENFVAQQTVQPDAQQVSTSATVALDLSVVQH